MRCVIYKFWFEGATIKELCQYLNNACFHELAKTGHEANIEAPEELAIVLQKFYDNIR